MQSDYQRCAKQDKTNLPGGTGNSGPPQGIAPNIGTKNRHKKKANNNELPNMESW